MKIIAVGMNYAQHNQELGHTQVNTEPVVFMKPDSAILKDGKPFFIPDFSNEIHYETELVVRIKRLGKNIAPRFANRYYDAVFCGYMFGIVFGLGLAGMWFAFALDECSRGAVLCLRWRTQKWKKRMLIKSPVNIS